MVDIASISIHLHQVSELPVVDRGTDIRNVGRFRLEIFEGIVVVLETLVVG